MIRFTAEKYQEEPECDRGMSSVITWVFRKLLRWTLYLMAAAWLCAVIYGITQQTPFLKLMVMSLLIAIMILLTGLVLLAVLFAIESVSKLLARLILYGKLPEGADNPIDGCIMYMMHGKEQ